MPSCLPDSKVVSSFLHMVQVISGCLHVAYTLFTRIHIHLKYQVRKEQLCCLRLPEQVKSRAYVELVCIHFVCCLPIVSQVRACWLSFEMRLSVCCSERWGDPAPCCSYEPSGPACTCSCTCFGCCCSGRCCCSCFPSCCLHPSC